MPDGEPTPVLETFAVSGGDSGTHASVDPVGDLMQDLDPAQFSKACLQIIDGDVDVQQILVAAKKDALEYAGRCFVAAMVVTTATGGTTAPASSMVCLGATATGAAKGAAIDYIMQKREDIALCASESIEVVVAAVLKAIDYLGWFEVEEVDPAIEEAEIAAIEGLGDPELSCAGGYVADGYRDSRACGTTQSLAPECWHLDEDSADYCQQIRETTERWARCRWSRVVSANMVWDGKPEKHIRAPINDATAYHDDCTVFLEERCGGSWSAADELTMRDDARALICQ